MPVLADELGRLIRALHDGTPENQMFCVQQNATRAHAGSVARTCIKGAAYRSVTPSASTSAMTVSQCQGRAGAGMHEGLERTA